MPKWLFWGNIIRVQQNARVVVVEPAQYQTHQMMYPCWPAAECHLCDHVTYDCLLSIVIECHQQLVTRLHHISSVMYVWNKCSKPLSSWRINTAKFDIRFHKNTTSLIMALFLEHQIMWSSESNTGRISVEYLDRYANWRHKKYRNLRKHVTNCLSGSLRLWWDWTVADSWTSGLCSSFYLHLQHTISADKQAQKAKIQQG